MKQEQRKALALAAVLALASSAAVSQQQAARPGGPAARAAQAAHSAADAGYKAYARRDFAAAVEAAQRAVQLAPDRRDYWLLLAQSQVAAGQPEQAEQSLARAAQARGDDAALARARTDLARARADLARARSQTAGEAMYKALQAGDVKAAIDSGIQAVALAPENAGYRLVLVHALLRDARFADAERVAGETIALLPDSAAPLALRGYARQGLNRAAEASADLDRALAQRGLNAATQRQLRLLAADLALAQNNGQRALDLLQPLAANDTEAAGRRELARQRIAARAVTPFVLRAPGIDCSNVDAAQTCTLQAAAVPPLPGFANATAGYAAMEQKDYARALEQARLATAAAPMQRDWQLLHMNAAFNAGEFAEAERAASAALDLGPPDGALLAQRSMVRRRLGDVSGANSDADAAIRTGTLPAATEASLLAEMGRTGEARARLASMPAADVTPQSRLDLAYLSTRMGDDRAALAAFQQADAAGALPVTSLLDAGYAAMKSREDNAAVAYFKRAIDAVNGLQLKMAPQMVYDTRRTVADVSRKWGVLASLTLRNGGGVEPGFGAVGGGSPGNRTTQAGVEGYWRPWGYRNGEFVELFARGFATLDNQRGGGFTGGDSFQGGVGARWKPMTSQNLVLSFSRVFGPNVNDDWLAQIGYSWDKGTDLRVDVPSWWTTQLSAEVGRYLENEINYGVASAKFGRSYLVGGSGRTVVYPHVFAGLEYTSNDPSAKTSAGAGPGVSLRHWFREDVYNAPRSYWDVTVQYRARITGDDRMRGLFLNTLLSY